MNSNSHILSQHRSLQIPLPHLDFLHKLIHLRFQPELCPLCINAILQAFQGFSKIEQRLGESRGGGIDGFQDFVDPGETGVEVLAAAADVVDAVDERRGERDEASEGG